MEKRNTGFRCPSAGRLEMDRYGMFRLSFLVSIEVLISVSAVIRRLLKIKYIAIHF